MTAAQIPSRDELIKIVEASGSSNEKFFGYPVKTDGLYLQQDPEEFAAFVHFMATKVGSATLSMDIGVASGGASKLLRDYFKCEKTIFVDIGLHPVFPHWERIKKTIDTEIVLEVIADSHLESTRQKLLPYANQVDFAFVDGDHSYKGLRQDIFLTMELLKVGGHMILHDTAAFGDCKRVFDDLLFSRNFVLVRNFQNRFGISVWLRTSDKKKPTAFNRKFGIGRI
jgi:hypothetical protein